MALLAPGAAPEQGINSTPSSPVGPAGAAGILLHFLGKDKKIPQPPGFVLQRVTQGQPRVTLGVP